ncbi:helix-turn-helix transcriptional regulator [Halobacillus massiliensis]|uniref:helix-turn-helix transcriptional regulator n=1 Tax=Halobacillus massiliensis TaxID=1926286 RepID=UPI0009E64961|nr:AraC family transcriptional regulator [Halobacillus massiliensis]
MNVTNKNGLLLLRKDKLGEREWRNDDYQTSYGDLSIDKGSFLIMNPEEKHKQLNVVEEKFLVELNPELIRSAAQQMGLSEREPEFSMIAYKHPQIQMWMLFVRDFLIEHENSEPEMNAFFLDNSLTQLSILLQYGAGSHLKEFPGQSSEAGIVRLLEVLKENFEKDWTLDEMAEHAQFNKYQFSHLFKQEIGLSPYSWLQLYRLFISKSALIQTQETVLSIALQHGFKSVNSYNHLFKKVYRKTPTEFRRNYRA